MHTFALIAAAIAIVAATSYSNKEALDCFENKATRLCAQELQDCLADPGCQNELPLYNHCSFGASEEQGGHEFNGYCLRRWQERARLTKPLIGCFRSSCNFAHNSEIGLAELFQCAQWVMFSGGFECGEECEDEMAKLGAGVYTTPLAELYSQPFVNAEAQTLADLIRQSCIGEGQGKQMIYEEQRLTEERRTGKRMSPPPAAPAPQVKASEEL